MKLILLSSSGRESLTVNAANWPIRIAFVAAVIVLIASGALMYHFTQDTLARNAEINMLNAWQVQRNNEQLEVEQTKVQIDHELSALTAKIASLQARIMRLDALGEQVAEMVNLDNGEFDFSQTPALGGPVVNPSDTINTGVEHVHKQVSDVLATAPTTENAANTNEVSMQESVGELYTLIEKLDYLIEDRESQLSILDKQLLVRDVKSESFIAGRPIKKGWMSSPFGFRTDPFNGKKAWHNGVDFAGSSGSDVIAVAGGVVTASEKRYGYGNMIEISHGNGVVTRYGHNASHLVKVGDIVEKGEAVAKMGSTGRSTGPHVHFEVLRHGKPINPERYIYRAGL